MVNLGRKPAWVDDEEEHTVVEILKVARLRKLRKEADERVISGRECEARLHGHHAKLNPFTGWEDMDRKAPLPGVYDDESGLLMLDGNAQEPSSGPINFVQFHRNGLLMLDARLDKRQRFFQMDGKRNPKIQSIFVEDCPVHKASFLPGGSELSYSLLLELIQQGLLRWVELLLYWVQPEGQGDAAPQGHSFPSKLCRRLLHPFLDYDT
ncbi:hypothetical protein ZWY2020_021071 [Hordeum vulgare]|nr:hypothetical protein ZWY2020_021071 [Hordeum vulgare]